MKNYTVFALLAICTMLFVACTAESTKNLEPEDLTRYYVKYEVNFTTRHFSVEKYFTVMTDKGTEDFYFDEDSKTSSWEGTYGPVDKEFVAYIKCSVPDYKYDSEIHARIYISREKEPFVIKAEGTGTYSLNLQTTIDF